jgi:hypothetical protein
MKYRLFIGLVTCWITVMGYAQDQAAVAQALFDRGEFSQALFLYEDLIKEEQASGYLHEQYLQCLVKTQDYDGAVKYLRKRGKKGFPTESMVAECWLWSLQEDGQEKEAQLAQHLIEKSREEYPRLMHLGSLFEQRNLDDWALECYQWAESNFGSNPYLNQRMAMLMLQGGRRSEALNRYVQLLANQNLSFTQLKPVFESHMSDSADMVMLQNALLESIQEQPDNPQLGEALNWTFIKTQDWARAFLFARSVDMRLKENGMRVFELGLLCESNKAFEEALKCFSYACEKAQTPESRKQALAHRNSLQYHWYQQSGADSAQWAALHSDMLHLEHEYGPDEITFVSSICWADLLMTQQMLPDRAIGLMERYYEISPESSPITVRAQAKIKAAEAWLVADEIWTAELLLAQVEKELKDEPIGQWAKFKRAELSFFRGDYEWADMQLDVLKDASTQLIANDAMELSLLIKENLGIDSNYTAMAQFSQAMLWERQRQFDSAYQAFDNIPLAFPGHSLSDDVLYHKAMIHHECKRDSQAIEALETLVLAFGHEVLADKALLQLAQWYEYQQGNSSKAAECYRKLILEHSASLHIIEARHAYRRLTGQ